MNKNKETIDDQLKEINEKTEKIQVQTDENDRTIEKNRED